MAIVASSPERRWLSGIVPFEIDGAVFPAGSPERGIVDMAISQFNGASTTIKLQPRNGEPDFVVFQEKDVNNDSPVGRQGGKQAVRCDIGGSRQRPIPGQLSQAPAALSVFNGQLHMVHLGDSSKDIWHSVFDGTNWSTNVTIPNQQSKAAPSLAFFNGQLHMLHLGEGSNESGTRCSTAVPGART
jgi:hypothetical protein